VKDDRLYLIHISECIDHIEQYVRDGKEGYLADAKTQDAVLRKLHVLSESSQRLSEALKKKYPEVDWRAISGFRNVVVHDYLGIDLEQVWQIVTHDLPDLKAKIKKALADLS